MSGIVLITTFVCCPPLLEPPTLVIAFSLSTSYLMSTDVPRHFRYPPVSLPIAPRRAVLQSLSTQETVPVHRHGVTAPMHKLSENGMQHEAHKYVQDRMRTAAPTMMAAERGRDQLAPLDGLNNLGPAAHVQPLSPKRAPAPITKEAAAGSHTSKKP